MQKIEITVYNFDELDDPAKERARAWYRDGLEYPWWGDVRKSLNDFAGYFGVRVIEWSLGCGSGRDHILTDAQGHHFRGKKLSEFTKFCHDGWWLDAILWEEFYAQFKRTGDAKYAFEQALNEAICAIQRDIDYQFSDECIDEMLTVNDYQFTETGKIF